MSPSPLKKVTGFINRVTNSKAYDMKCKDIEVDDCEKEKKKHWWKRSKSKSATKVKAAEATAKATSHCFAPSHCRLQFEAHDNDVNSIAWANNGSLFATGGTDRTVKVWEMTESGADLKATLVGCRQGATEVQFDNNEKLVLASCNDHSARIWNWDDERLKSTFTGHTDKVLSAQFRQQGQEIVTGSHDSTVKLWDIKAVKCVRTLFARSRCNAVVSHEGPGNSVISGHLDKKMRFWDSRTNEPSTEIVLHGKITSLDLSNDGMYVLACTRDDSLNLIDLRTMTIIHTYWSDFFNVSTDHSRAVLSPDMQYCMSGAVDGSLYIWDINTTRVEKVVASAREDKNEVPVLTCAWQPTGKGVLSGDKQKIVCYWDDTA